MPCSKKERDLEFAHLWHKSAISGCTLKTNLRHGRRTEAERISAETQGVIGIPVNGRMTECVSAKAVCEGLAN
jgi:hypothetical protein